MRSPKRRSLAAASSEPSPKDGNWLARTGAAAAWAWDMLLAASISQQAKPTRLSQPRGKRLGRCVWVAQLGEGKSLMS
jgi:hypothetical protein